MIVPGGDVVVFVLQTHVSIQNVNIIDINEKLTKKTWKGR